MKAEQSCEWSQGSSRSAQPGAAQEEQGSRQGHFQWKQWREKNQPGWPLRTLAGRVLVAAQMPGSEWPFAASWLVSVSCDMTSPTPPTITRKCLWFPSLLKAGLSDRPVPHPALVLRCFFVVQSEMSLRSETSSCVMTPFSD